MMRTIMRIDQILLDASRSAGEWQEQSQMPWQRRWHMLLEPGGIIVFVIHYLGAATSLPLSHIFRNHFD